MLPAISCLAPRLMYDNMGNWEYPFSIQRNFVAFYVNFNLYLDGGGSKCGQMYVNVIKSLQQ